MTPTIEEIRAAPKVLLHDHLDGGLRPATVVELAGEIGYDKLPSQDVDEVARWLRRGAHRGHLNLYLDAFQHTVAVMQTPEALTRVAAECAEDLAADGIVYAEVRFAPELHVAAGLTLDEVVRAVLDGFRIGSAGRGITVYALFTRDAHGPLAGDRRARRALRDAGVVGFDIAGARPAARPACTWTRSSTRPGRTSTSPSMPGKGSGALHLGGAPVVPSAERLGHGARIVDDIRISPDGTAHAGRLAGTCGTGAPRWRCAPARTCRPAPPPHRGPPDPAAPPAVPPVTVNTDNG